MSEGVQVYDSDKAFEGYTLYCQTFLDLDLDKGERGKINLIDMEGNIVHRWYAKTALQSFCRLLPDGNILYPTRDRSNLAEAGLRELNPDSEVVWYYHCRIDHDYQVLDNGNLLLHTITDNMSPNLGKELKRQPYIIEITPDKELLWEWRGEDHVDEFKELLSKESWEFFWERVKGRYSFDWAHNNTCQVIGPNKTYEKEKEAGGPVRFKPGNIIFSYRSLDTIGVIERETGDIVWAWGPGVIDGQHKPHMLENGNILIYDNGTLRGYSRVIELNPLTEEIEWEYTSEPKSDFLSKFISGAQRLPNGNTLICEGSECHLFEVTPDKEIVWDYYSPSDEESMGTVYRCLRYTEDEVQALLDRI